MAAAEHRLLPIFLVGERADTDAEWACLEAEVWPALGAACRRAGRTPVLHRLDLSDPLNAHDLRAALEARGGPMVWLVVLGETYGPAANAALVDLLAALHDVRIEPGASAVDVLLRYALSDREAVRTLVLVRRTAAGALDPRVRRLVAELERDGVVPILYQAPDNGTRGAGFAAVVRQWFARDVLPALSALDLALPGAEPPRSDTGPAASDAEEDASIARAAGDNVQFTVHRPRAMRPERWYPLLVQAHLAERRPDADPEAPDPIDEARRQAEERLGAQARDYRSSTQDGGAAIPSAGQLTFIPAVDGVEFNPDRRTFLWLEDVHTEDFRCKADRELEGQTARGSVSVYLGSLLVAEVPIAIPVRGAAAARQAPADMERAAARPYRKIFPSYSHLDTDVVRQCERYASLLGDVYLRDAVALRSGEPWGPRLRQLIGEADVFQLFWSRNAMRSPHVRSEWEYALQLEAARPRFVRPTYWEEPLPRDRANHLPPPELERLHFQRLGEVTQPMTRGAAGAGPANDAPTLPPMPAPPASASPPASVGWEEEATVIVRHEQPPVLCPAPPARDAPPQRRMLSYLGIGLALVAVIAAAFWWLMEGP